MTSNTDAYNEICCYTLTHSGAGFIHQHVVDAFAAQDATPHDKPIRLTFALVGLYLHVERDFSGRDVQLAHMKLGRNKQHWPTFEFPKDRGRIDAMAVVAAPVDQRDQMIHDWTKSVWNAFADQRSKIEQLLESNGISDSRSLALNENNIAEKANNAVNRSGENGRPDLPDIDNHSSPPGYGGR